MGAFQNSWRLVQKGLERMFSVHDPALAEDERLLAESTGSLVQGLVPAQGRIMLTTKRVIYLPFRLIIIPKWLYPWRRVEIQLTEVRGVSKGSRLRRLWGAFGLPILKICLGNGEVYNFQLLFADRWRAEIERLIGTKSETQNR